MFIILLLNLIKPREARTSNVAIPDLFFAFAYLQFYPCLYQLKEGAFEASSFVAAARCSFLTVVEVWS